MERQERMQKLNEIKEQLKNVNPEKVKAFPELFALVQQLILESEYEDISNQTLKDTIEQIGIILDDKS